MRHVIDTQILQELINKVKTLPYEQVADLLSKTVASAMQVNEAPAPTEPKLETAADAPTLEAPSDTTT